MSEWKTTVMELLVDTKRGGLSLSQYLPTSGALLSGPSYSARKSKWHWLPPSRANSSPKSTATRSESGTRTFHTQCRWER